MSKVYETSEFHVENFKWSNGRFSNGFHHSDCFNFCGNNCYLVTEFGYKYSFAISLHGSLESHIKNISSQFSIIMQNVNGVKFVNTSGQMQIRKERFSVNLYKGYLYKGCDDFTICFSWCEDEPNELFSEAVQRKMQLERDQIVERRIQTKEMQVSLMRNDCTHAACCSNVVQCESQTTVEEIPFSSGVCTIEEKETYQFLDEMSNDFRPFFESKTTTDCVLSIGETKFPAHRSVLSDHSTVFAAMFHHDTSESQKGEVIIQDVDTAVFGHVLYFIYTGKVRGLSSETATPMYTFAHKYALISLRDKCLDYLLCNLNVKNICDAALLADVHAETKLEKKVVKFIKERLQELIETEKWKDFTNIHSKLVYKFLCSALMSN